MSFTIPESLDGLDKDALNALIAEAKGAASEIAANDDASMDDLREAQSYINWANDVASARIAEIDAEEQERADTLAAIREASKEQEPAEEQEPETDEVEEPAEEEVKEPVTAASTAVARARAAAPKPKAPAPEKQTVALNRGEMSITAAADLPGYSHGAKFATLDQVAKGAQARLKGYPTARIGGPAGTRIKNGIASFNIHEARTDGFFQGNPDFKDDQALLVAASKEARLGQPLTAAGGWCAPSDTLMDFCSEESTDGILSLPTVTADRGSVRWTKGPDFSAIYANADGDWDYTEAQVIADTEKPCIEVECPAFQETVLGVTGVCISAGILTQAAYPELVRRYIEAVLIAHQHKVGGRLYQAIDTASTALTIAGAVSAFDSLGHVEIAIQHMREVKRMSMGTTMEVLAPFWYKSIIRGDLARRTGVDMLSVTDQQINAFFAARGASVQWLYNTGQEISNVTDTITVPGTVDLLIYPAGSFVKLTTDLITLDGLYDSTNLKTNTFTALFTEEGYAVVNMCGDAYKVSVSTCMTGQTGAADITACLVAATV